MFLFIFTGSHTLREGEKITTSSHERCIETSTNFTGRGHNFTVERYLQKSCYLTLTNEGIIMSRKPSCHQSWRWLCERNMFAWQHSCCLHPSNTVLIWVELRGRKIKWAWQRSCDWCCANRAKLWICAALNGVTTGVELKPSYAQILNLPGNVAWLQLVLSHYRSIKIVL